MKRVTIATTDGNTITEDAINGAELPQALQEQQPAFALRLKDDGSVLYLNCRQVIGVSVEDVPEEDVSSDAPEDTRTVAELKDALDAKGVEYPATAKKAELQELASSSGV